MPFSLDQIGYLNPFIIAEIGVNHECNLDLACKMIDDIAQAGGHAAKFQAYKADKLAARESPAYWDTNQEPTSSQHSLFSKYDKFTVNDYIQLAERCKQRDICFMATTFDIDFCDALNDYIDIHKVASADITNLPLLRKIGSFKKPVLLSCGASSLEEVKEALSCLRQAGAGNIIPLHCVLNYPTDIENAALGMIDYLQKQLNIQVGYSDHTIPTSCHTIQISSIIAGAVVLEKHFTFDKGLSGNDHYHSFDCEDLRSFTAKLDVIKKSFFSPNILTNIYDENQKLARQNARRSLYYARSLTSGTILQESDLIAKRPGNGISPMDIDNFIGRLLLNNVAEDSLVNLSDFYDE